MSDRTPEQRAADRREIEELHPGERFQMMLDAPTPETDAYSGTHETHRINGLTLYDRAKQLERERNEKIADIQKAADEIDRWRKLARRENERALSLEEECNGLRARVAELEELGNRLLIHASCECDHGCDGRVYPRIGDPCQRCKTRESWKAALAKKEDESPTSSSA